MVVAATIFVIVAFLALSRSQSRLYRYAGGMALAGHILFAIVVLPLVPYSWDINIFHSVALGILNGAEAAPLSPLDAFGTVQAVVYAVFGADPTQLAILNGLVAVLLPLPACYVARQLYDPLDSSDGLLLVLLFLPFPFLFNSLPMRDALSTLVVVTLLAVCVAVAVEGRRWWALTAPPLWGMLVLLREELAVLVLLGAAAAALVAAITRATGEEPSLRGLALAALPVGLAGFALFTRLFPVDSLNARLQYRAAGGASYLPFMRYESWLDVVIAAPVRAIYFQFAPFPLHVDSAFDLVAVCTLPLLVVLSVTAYRSVRGVETDALAEILLAVVYFGGIVGYGLIDSNFGTTIRHRGVFVFLLAVFSAPILESWYRSLRDLYHSVDQHRQTDEKQREAEEFDPRAEIRDEHRQDAHRNEAS